MGLWTQNAHQLMQHSSKTNNFSNEEVIQFLRSASHYALNRSEILLRIIALQSPSTLFSQSHIIDFAAQLETMFSHIVDAPCPSSNAAVFPEKKICKQFRMSGRCSFGSRCLYHHTQAPSTVALALPRSPLTPILPLHNTAQPYVMVPLTLPSGAVYGFVPLPVGASGVQGGMNA